MLQPDSTNRSKPALYNNQVFSRLIWLIYLLSLVLAGAILYSFPFEGHTRDLSQQIQWVILPYIVWILLDFVMLWLFAFLFMKPIQHEEEALGLDWTLWWHIPLLPGCISEKTQHRIYLYMLNGAFAIIIGVSIAWESNTHIYYEIPYEITP